MHRFIEPQKSGDSRAHWRAGSVLVLFAWCFPPPGAAGGNFSYTFVDAAYVDSELQKEISEDGNGFRVSTSLGIARNLFLFARYQDFDFGQLADTELFNGGLGVHLGLGALPADLVLKAGYVHAEARFHAPDDFDGNLPDSGFLGLEVSPILGGLGPDADFEDARLSDEGYLASAGLRIRLLPALEVEGGINYINFSDADEAAYFDAAARLHVTSFLALQAGAEFDDGDNFLYLVGLRAQFPGFGAAPDEDE